MFKVTIKSLNVAQLTDLDTGKVYELPGNWHARSLGGEYKYHEYYVFLNKIDTTKYPELAGIKTKAPKTLDLQWKVEPKPEHDDDWWKATKIDQWAHIPGKLIGATTILKINGGGGKYDLNKMKHLFDKENK